MQATVPGYELESKPVYDWNRRIIGTVEDIEKNPKTNAARHLLVNLSSEARDLLGAGDGLVTIPMNYVCGIGRDSVTLDRGVQELRHAELMRQILRS